MAAEALAAAGRAVVVAEAKPTVGRKLLMAGKSGLNLTKADAPDVFAAAYRAGGDWLAPMLAAFGPDEVRGLGRGPGIATFTGSSRAGLSAGDEGLAAAARLAAPARGRRASTFRTRWRWTGWDGPLALRHARGRRGIARRGDRARARRRLLGAARLGWRLGAGPRRRRRAARAVPPVERRLRGRLVAGDGAPLRRPGQGGAAHGRRARASPRSSSSPRAASRAAASMRSPTACATARR